MINSNGIRVLICEDDYLVCQMVGTLLTKSGYTVVGEAANGLEGIELAAELNPDVILMDLDMPEMNGIEATRAIIAQQPRPIVVLTAYETPELLRQAGEAGAGAYLVKPSNRQEIERAITIALARFNDMMELRRLNHELEEALAQVKQLSGLLPICAGCKKIRDDNGYWQQVEVYIRDHSEADFSHGLCPDCAKKLYPTIFKE